MQHGNFNYYIIIIIVVLGLLFLSQTRNIKKQQRTVQQFRDELQPGSLVITIGGIIGKVVSVDNKYEEIVIDSEGTLLRFTMRAVNKAYVRPAFIDDEPEDEETPGTTDEPDSKEVFEDQGVMSQGTQAAPQSEY